MPSLSPTEHHPTMPPSSWGALLECGQFKPKPGQESAALDRGNRLHEYLAALLHPEQPPLPSNLSLDEVQEVQWAANEIRKAAGAADLHVEERVELVNADFDPVTFGTVDAWCKSSNRVQIFDLKTGERHSYMPQMAAYAAALLQQTGADEVVATLLFSRSRTSDIYTFTHESAAEVVESVVDNVERQALRANNYCGWCDRSLTCYAFAKKARAVREQLSWDVQDFEPEQLKDDPAELGKALHLAKHLKAWCKTVEDHAKAQEEPPPGWRWSVRKSQTVPSLMEALEDLGLPAPSNARSATVAEITRMYAEHHSLTTKAARSAVEEELSGTINTTETKTLKESK